MAKVKLPATERVLNYTPGTWIIPTENGVYTLCQEPLPKMTQEKAAKYLSREGFHAASLPQYFDLFVGLYALRNSSKAEEARKFIQHEMRANPLTTLTRIKYMPEGEDRIIHNYGTKEKKEVHADLVGEEGKLSDVLSLEACLALTGKNPEEVEEIIRYINGTSIYLWRLNSKPRAINERVARFGVYSDWAGLNCYGYPPYASATLGVRAVRKQNLGVINTIP